MKTNKEFINGIYEKVDEISKEKSDNKQKNINKIINIAAILVIIFSIGVNVNIHQKEKREEIKRENIIIKEKKIGLETVNNFENFCNIIKNSKENQNVRYYDEKSVITEAATEKNAITNSMANATDSKIDNVTNTTTESKTNTQVENVDEADIVKVNQNYIYYVSQKKIVIIDAHKGENSSKIAEINYEKEKFIPKEIYVNNNKLVVIGGELDSMRYNTTEKLSADVLKMESKTQLIIYDVSNKISPKEIRKIEIEGEYLSSRMVENNIYLATSKNIYSSEILEKNKEELDEQSYKPRYTDTAVSQESKCIEYDRIYCFNQIDTTNYLMLAGLNIDNSEEIDIQTFLGAGQHIYSSEKNMYIAKTNIEYAEGKFKSGNTHILKFALDNGKIKFQAEANVQGQINNQFSMDETEEYFRIATTIGDMWNIDENTSNNLYVLNSKLEEVGKVTGFGKEEKIYSVRYTEKLAYVVTYKQTDPLFVIDLSEPTNPHILGELKLPGYSTYLHQYDETHLIGFGYDTKEEGTRITTNGLKMVMFDISNLSNPKELYNITIGDKYTSSELIYNHKALLYSKENNIIAFPLTTYGRNNTVSKVAIYNINLNEGFVLKGEIVNTTKDYDKFIERIVYVNNTYYTLSSKLIKAVDRDSLKIIREIEI